MTGSVRLYKKWELLWACLLSFTLGKLWFLLLASIYWECS